MRTPVYLDHAATTPVRPEVLEAMLPFFGPRFGNPSSVHKWGREARTALDAAEIFPHVSWGTNPGQVSQHDQNSDGPVERSGPGGVSGLARSPLRSSHADHHLARHLSVTCADGILAASRVVMVAHQSALAGDGRGLAA